MPEYTVMVSLDGGRTFAVHPEPIEAGTRQSACEKLHKASPELLRDEAAQFWADPDFKPIAKRRQLVEKWAWGEPKSGDEGQQEQLGRDG